MKKLVLMIALCGQVNYCGEARQAKEGDDMFSFEGVASPVNFMNYQRNSFASVEVTSKLVPFWVREYAAVDENAVFVPIAVLVGASHIGVQSGGELLMYNQNGVFQYMEPISETAPVIFGREAMALVKPSLELVYQDYARNPKGDERTIPGLIQWAFALMLKPEAKEVVAAVQFTGGPQRKPRHFSACAFVLPSRARRWFFDIPGSVDHLLLTNDGQKMVLIRDGEAELRSIKDGNTMSMFRTDLQTCLAASLDTEDHLLVISESTEDVVTSKQLTAFDLAGNKLWKYSSVVMQSHQPPVCGPNGGVYLVNGGSLECIKKGSLVWSSPLKSGDKTYVTVDKDGAAIVLNGRWLCLISPEGRQLAERLLSTDLDETFNAPPSVDASGRILVASGLKLYCFK